MGGWSKQRQIKAQLNATTSSDITPRGEDPLVSHDSYQ